MKRSSILRYKIFAPVVAVLGLLTTVLTPLPNAFADATPTVTSVVPDHGPTAGGTAITITGTGFNGGHNASEVTIGGSAATSVVVVNHNTITAVTPPGALGPALVVVSNHDPELKSSTQEVYFTYLNAVTFDANGGTGAMSAQLEAAPTALTANAFTRAGYTFAGWNTIAEGGGDAYADAATYSFAASITLYAQWVAIPNHTVTFNANGGTGTMSDQTTNVPTALTANAFARAGYTFLRWDTLSGGTGVSYLDGATYDFTANMTLYAQWAVVGSHTVTFMGNGGSGSTGPQATNVPTALIPNAFTYLGYTFNRWDTDPEGTGTSYANGAIYSFAADLTLYAQWSALPNNTVTFNANGGTGSTGPQTTNVPTALIPNAFTRTSYTFAGWNTAADNSGTAYANGAVYSFTADITLYAQWAGVSHTVVFNANGGSGSMSSQTANLSTALTANAFTRTGYTFAGWNTIAIGGGTAYANGAMYDFTADMTLYAQWTVIPSHTVTFIANGGSGSMSAQIANVATALTANAFALSGYNFAGWNTIATGGGGAYSNGATYSFAADMILYAQWTLAVVTPVYVPPVTATPAPPAAPPAPLVQVPLVLHVNATEIPLGAFAALNTTGGSGNGVVTYATSTPADCAVDSYGLVTGIIAGTCTVIATKAADSTYLAATTAPLDLTFIDLMAGITPEPPAASPGLPATGLAASVVRTVKVSGSALSKSIMINLGAALGGKKATIQMRKVGTTVYRTLSTVTLNKAGVARFTRLVPKGSAIRVLVGGRSLAATIVR